MMNRGIWAVFDFYFYFFRRKTNIELRYVSLFQFLLLLFPSKDQPSNCGKRLLFQKKLLLFSDESRRWKRPILDFYFFSGRNKVQKRTFFVRNRCFGVPTGPPEWVFARHSRTKLSRAIVRIVETRWTQLSFWTFLKTAKTYIKMSYLQNLINSLLLKLNFKKAHFRPLPALNY